MVAPVVTGGVALGNHGPVAGPRPAWGQAVACPPAFGGGRKGPGPVVAAPGSLPRTRPGRCGRPGRSARRAGIIDDPPRRARPRCGGRAGSRACTVPGHDVPGAVGRLPVARERADGALGYRRASVGLPSWRPGHRGHPRLAGGRPTRWPPTRRDQDRARRPGRPRPPPVPDGSAVRATDRAGEHRRGPGATTPDTRRRPFPDHLVVGDRLVGGRGRGSQDGLPDRRGRAAAVSLRRREPPLSRGVDQSRCPPPGGHPHVARPSGRWPGGDRGGTPPGGGVRAGIPRVPVLRRS